MIHAIINKKDGQIWYEGIDKADACNQMKPSFMSWIESGKTMKDFPLYYEVIPEKPTLSELKEQLASAKQQLIDLRPPRLTLEDHEDVSDNYQAHLEYNYWAQEQRELIRELEQQIKDEINIYLDKNPI